MTERPGELKVRTFHVEVTVCAVGWGEGGTCCILIIEIN